VAGFGHRVRWPSAWNARILAFLKQHPLAK
jgi:hypothetical protein